MLVKGRISLNHLSGYHIQSIICGIVIVINAQKTRVRNTSVRSCWGAIHILDWQSGVRMHGYRRAALFAKSFVAEVVVAIWRLPDCSCRYKSPSRRRLSFDDDLEDQVAIVVNGTASKFESALGIT